MKYLKSTTQKSYQFEGKKIPPCVTKDNEWLSMTDQAYRDFAKATVIKALINGGAILVTDQEPTSPTKQVKNLTNLNAQQAVRITQLEEELKQAKAANTGSAEIETLKAALEKQKADDLAEIQALQSEKDAEIEKLKAELKKATKKGE